MKHKFKLLIYLFLLLLFSKNFVLASKIAILYKVENQPITNQDIEKEVNYLLLLNDQLKNINDNELIKYATKSLIKDKVKKIELENKLEFGNNEEFISNKLNNFQQSMNLTSDEFNLMLANRGLSINYLEDKIELEYLWNRLIYLLYKDMVVINEKEIKEKIKEDINDPKNFLDEFLLYEILYSFSQEKNTENEINKIKKSITENGFENTANILSDADSSSASGKIGWVKENQLSKEIFNNIKNLNINEYAGPIDVTGGKVFLLLKEKRQVKKNLSLEDEFKQFVIIERNRQLDQFSSIYYKKVEINTRIYDN